MGLTHIKGNKPTKQETEVAKNYLTEPELNMLNRMVSAYLDLAEIQALNQKPMYMTDWITKLDEFIKISGNDILDHLGSISHEQALQKANEQYEKFKEQDKKGPSQVEIHFVKHLESSAKELKGKKGRK